jgi:hypothetical protein
MMMSFNSAELTRENVYQTHNGYGARETFWVLEEPIAYNGKVVALKMRQVDTLNWELTNKVRTFSNDNFFDGSGFGGGPFLRPDFRYKVKNGALFYQFFFQPIIPRPSFFRRMFSRLADL